MGKRFQKREQRVERAGQRPHGAFERFLSILLSGWIASGTPTVAFAAPEGEQVVQGDVSFAREGALTTIEAGHNAIIEYSRFDIASHETVRFIQPSETARVLNRVLSVDPSLIDGSLLANGQVIIVNPSGVFFGPGSFVDTASLTVVAGSLSNQDFLGGVDHFQQLSGPVENYGEIHANVVNLVGRYAANHGAIVAEDGLITMVAGESVILARLGERMAVRLSAEGGPPADPGTPGVANQGRLDAGSGAVRLAAGDIYSLAVFHDGTTRASEIALGGGGEGLVQVAGTLDASNAEGVGGRIEVLGDKVAVADATLDASGSAGGGEILVGGDSQGGGGLPSARRTYVSAEATLRADATQRGDGGRVIVWADEAAWIHGEITARGGPEGGDGGFVETSGRKHLSVTKAADASAPAGQGGTWLLDPEDVRICSNCVTSDNIDQSNPFRPTGIDPTPALLNVELINMALDEGSNVTVSTEIVPEPEPDSGRGTIEVDAAIVKSKGANDSELFLVAKKNITVNPSGSIASVAGPESEPAVGKLKVVLTAGENVDLNGSVTTRGGAFSSTSTGGGTFISTAEIDAGSGEVTLSHEGATMLGAKVTAGSFETNGGGTTHLQVDPDLGPAVTTSGRQTYHDAVTLGANTVLAANDVTFSQTLGSASTTAQDLEVNTSGEGVTTFLGAVGTTPLRDLRTNEDGSTAINGGSVITTGDQSYGDPVAVGGKDVLLDAGNDLSFGDDVTTDGTASMLAVKAGRDIAAGGDIGAGSEHFEVVSLDANLRDGGATDRNGTISFTDDALQAVHAVKTIGLSTNQDAPPTVATIFRTNAQVGTSSQDRLILDSGGDVSLAQNDKLTVPDGGLLIMGDKVTVGDLNALTVQIGSSTAPVQQLTIVRRPAGLIELSNGALVQDHGVDLVGNQVLVYAQSPFASAGSGPIPTIATPEGGAAPGELSDFLIDNRDSGAYLLRVYSTTPGQPVQSADMRTPDEVADLSEYGPGEGPQDFVPYVPTYEEKNPTAVTNSIAVGTMPPRADELLAWFDCMDEDLGMQCEEQAIQPQRAVSAPAAKVRENVKQLAPEEQQRAALQAAVDAYRGKTGQSSVHGAEFRRFVEGSSEQKPALEVLARYGEILVGIREFGATDEAYQELKRERLTRIAPTGISVVELGQAVELGITAWRTEPDRRVAAADRFDLYLGLHPAGLLAPAKTPALP